MTLYESSRESTHEKFVTKLVGRKPLVVCQELNTHDPEDGTGDRVADGGCPQRIRDGQQGHDCGGKKERGGNQARDKRGRYLKTHETDILQILLIRCNRRA